MQELKLLAQEDPSVSIGDEVAKLEQKAAQLLQETYASLTPWQKVQVARHPARPHFLDYVERLAEDFTPLAGDRVYGEDAAIVGGIGRFRGRSVMFIGHEKGSDTQSRLKHNFGMARPEGYRKAIRLMTLAERFGIPVVTLADTSGAYPGMESEERSVAEAIARSTDRCLSLGVPLVSVIIGEGMSGGAIGIACGNRVLVGLILRVQSSGPVHNMLQDFNTEIFFYVLLPPIIFEAGYNMQRRKFFQNIGAICMFAFLGTLISTIIIAAVLWCENILEQPVEQRCRSQSLL